MTVMAEHTAITKVAADRISGGETNVNDSQFDALAHVVGQAVPRRIALRALTAALAVTVRRPRWGSAAVSCTKLRRRCAKDQECCANSRCQRNRCQCRPGRDRCGRFCCDRGDICVNGRCVTGQGDCPNGADTCAGNFFACNGGCNCFKRFGGGTRCGGSLTGSCGGCIRDGDCADLGPGAFCAVSHAPECVQCVPGLGRCVAPCLL